jgi:hypothetical protein
MISVYLLGDSPSFGQASVRPGVKPRMRGSRFSALITRSFGKFRKNLAPRHREKLHLWSTSGAIGQEVGNMSPKLTFLASVVCLSVALVSHAHAFVVYSVFNPAAPPFPFVLFTYDSPSFITTDTTVPVADLSANPKNSITSVEFIPISTDPLDPGVTVSELDVFQSAAAEQVRYYPEGTFTGYGVTPGLFGSFGYPNSDLRVAAPEPATIAVLGVGLLGLLGLRRRLS